MAEFSEDAAGAEFDRWAELCEFDLDPRFMSQEGQEDCARRRHIAEREIMSGRITIDDEGNLSYQMKIPVKGVEVVSFPVDPDGTALLAFDTTKDGRNIAKLYAMIQAMTGMPPGTMAAMKRRDREVVQAVAGFF